MVKKFDGLFDDSISPTSTRAGRVINRVDRMSKAKVSPKTQASQMTDNSPTGQNYEARDVLAFQKLAADSKVKVVVTQDQANALIQDEVENGNSFDAELEPSK